MKLSRAREWFHTLARISSVCFLAGAVTAYAYVRWLQRHVVGGLEPRIGFGLAMSLLLILAISSAFLAAALPGKRGSKPLSPLWPYMVLIFATMFCALLTPQVH